MNLREKMPAVHFHLLDVTGGENSHLFSDFFRKIFFENFVQNNEQPERHDLFSVSFTIILQYFTKECNALAFMIFI